MARPFKVLIPEQKEQFGVVARSLRVLRDSIQKRYGLKGGFKIYLTDGTAVDDEEYFAFLEPQTLLIVKHALTPSGDTKTSVVDLTSKEARALVCGEDESFEQSHHQSKNTDISKTTDQPTENKNTGAQDLTVFSIQIAKVHEDVEWEGEGAPVQTNNSPVDPHAQQQQKQQLLVHHRPTTVSQAGAVMHHHLSLMSNPAPQMARVYYSPAASSMPSDKTVFHQQPPHYQQQQQQQQHHHHHQQQHQQQQQQQPQVLNTDAALLQQLYQQSQLQKRYLYQHQQHQQISSQTQACNSALRPSQRYYIQQYQQQIERNRNLQRNRNYQILQQLSSCKYSGMDRVQQQQLSCPPPY